MTEEQNMQISSDQKCGFCNLPMSKNPHPDAGKPEHLLNVGAVYVCIPCTVKTRHSYFEQKGKLERKLSELKELINSPQTDDFIKALPLEAAFQITHWGKQHDAHKTNHDWFWTLGYLSQKAIVALDQGDIKKAKHHTISSAALLLNWFRKIVEDFPLQENPAEESETIQPA